MGAPRAMLSKTRVSPVTTRDDFRKEWAGRPARETPNGAAKESSRRWSKPEWGWKPVCLKLGCIGVIQVVSDQMPRLKKLRWSRLQLPSQDPVFPPLFFRLVPYTWFHFQALSLLVVRWFLAVLWVLFKSEQLLESLRLVGLDSQGQEVTSRVWKKVCYGLNMVPTPNLCRSLNSNVIN